MVELRVDWWPCLVSRGLGRRVLGWCSTTPGLTYIRPTHEKRTNCATEWISGWIPNLDSRWIRGGWRRRDGLRRLGISSVKPVGRLISTTVRVSPLIWHLGFRHVRAVGKDIDWSGSYWGIGLMRLKNDLPLMRNRVRTVAPKWLHCSFGGLHGVSDRMYKLRWRLHRPLEVLR
jgi:hypothetical protein